MNSSRPTITWRPRSALVIDLTGAQEFEKFNSTGEFPVTLEPTIGNIPDLKMKGGQSHSLSVWTSKSKSGIRSAPRIDDDYIMIRYVLNGQWIRRNIATEYIVEPGQAVLVSLRDMVGEQTSSNFEEIACAITRPALQTARENLDGEAQSSISELSPVARADETSMRNLLLTLMATHRHIVNEGSSNDLMFPMLEEILTYQILSCWPACDASGKIDLQSKSASHVHHAKTYIEEYLSHPIRLSEIAASVGISVRCLQRSFKHEMNTTPVEFIIERRLQKVHQDLLRGVGPTAASIARRWGFVHISDFTQRYHRRFGCTPGKTFRR